MRDSTSCPSTLGISGDRGESPRAVVPSGVAAWITGEFEIRNELGTHIHYDALIPSPDTVRRWHGSSGCSQPLEAFTTTLLDAMAERGRQDGGADTSIRLCRTHAMGAEAAPTFGAGRRHWVFSEHRAGGHGR